MGGRGSLIGIGCAVAALGLAFAQTAPVPATPPQSITAYDMTAGLTWSDNYRRLPERRLRTDIDPTVPSVAQVTADIDPPSNTIATVTLSGTTLVRRPGIEGYLGGDLLIGGYLEGTDLEADLVGTSSPAAPFGATPDAQGRVSSFGFGDPDEVFIEPNLAGAATLRLKDNRLYVDGSVLATQQSLNQSSLLAQESIGGTGDEVTLLGASISPYLVWRGDQDIRGEFRVTGSSVVTLDDQLTSAEFEGVDKYTNDSHAIVVTSAIDSGNRFGKLRVGAQSRYRAIDEQGSDVLAEVETREFSTELNWAIQFSQKVEAIFAVGYDDITLTASDTAGAADQAVFADEEDRLTGGFYRAGFAYRPSERTRVSFAIGERFGETDIRSEWEWRPTARMTLSGRASRQFDTGAQNSVGALSGIGLTNEATLAQIRSLRSAFASSLIDQAIVIGEAVSSLSDRFATGPFTIDEVVFNLSGDFRRTDLLFGMSFIRRTFGEDVEQALSARFEAERALSRKLTMSAEAAVTRTEGGEVVVLSDPLTVAAREDELAQYYRLGVNSRLGRSLSAQLDVAHTVNDVEGAPVTGTSFDYQETAITAAMRWSF
ncbi:hypothetical protein PB2503_10524 [Parvularcula bermudensis HTCC2503]|uniref:Uncharacterized protein n=1 Tax=Parvularcula bermudensis (strain ATCC BAA-594 / HTCC2503 / KCTC 12087) TaxID=314260 RepID=E0TGM4_PARBH|nr:hypothetical protein [Parvularcula bermudensis]ADM10156.1 hypothetical protein PB2503_10524 [Parvularcula bermudensis HTCC2503]